MGMHGQTTRTPAQGVVTSSEGQAETEGIESWSRSIFILKRPRSRGRARPNSLKGSSPEGEPEVRRVGLRPPEPTDAPTSQG